MTCCRWLAVVLLALTSCTSNNEMVQPELPAATQARLVDVDDAKVEAASLDVVAAYAARRAPGQLTVAYQPTDEENAALSVLQAAPVWREFMTLVESEGRLVELFTINIPRGGDTASGQCRSAETCRRIEIYDYSANQAVTAYVDLDSSNVTSLVSTETQPDIPPHLVEVAEAIANGSEIVQENLAARQIGTDAVMAAAKTAFNQSRCERQRNLCVAPTFLGETGALWAIVNLTELHLAAVAWTELGITDLESGNAQPVTLRRAEESLIEQACTDEQRLRHGSWTADYQLTSSDGMRVTDLRFDGELVATNISLVDWHVNYSASDGFGYSDAVGCPAFSLAAVIAADLPSTRVLEANEGSGVSLEVDYWSDGWPQPCNYNYRQAIHLLDDGSFRIVAMSLGRGCGDDGIYRPVFRVALPPELSTVASRDGTIDQELIVAMSGDDYLSLGTPYQLSPSSGGLPSEQGRPSFAYITQGHRADEGGIELPTLGSCCNADENQGPEVFVDGESIDGNETVVWLVGELHNDATPGAETCWARPTVGPNGEPNAESWPCSFAPLFDRGDQ